MTCFYYKYRILVYLVLITSRTVLLTPSFGSHRVSVGIYWYLAFLFYTHCIPLFSVVSSLDVSVLTGWLVSWLRLYSVYSLLANGKIWPKSNNTHICTDVCIQSWAKIIRYHRSSCVCLPCGYVGLEWSNKNIKTFCPSPSNAVTARISRLSQHGGVIEEHSSAGAHSLLASHI